MQALGTDQAKHMTECMEQRYPRADRVERAVWRGSTTDHHLGSWLTASSWDRNVRVQLVLRASNMSDVADFGLTHLWVGAPLDAVCALFLPGLGAPVPLGAHACVGKTMILPVSTLCCVC